MVNQGNKKINKENAKYLDFKHRKLNDKAREFRHEISHITIDLIDINRRIHETLVNCKHRIDIFGDPKKNHLADKNQMQHFDNLLYHLENFAFRMQAYRDKLSLFINFGMNIGFEERDFGLIFRLIKNPISKEFHMDTELKKFEQEPIKKMLNLRKQMSHRSYYAADCHNPLFTPKGIDPKKVGYKKASLLWKKNISNECKSVNETVLKVLDINEKVSEKMIKFLDLQK